MRGLAGRVGTALLAVAACSTPTHRPATAPAPPTPNPRLAAAVLPGSAIGRDVASQVVAAGLSLPGHPTLDVCARRFPADTNRVAREQVEYINPGGQPLVSEELVLYHAGDGQRAYRELAHALGHCPRRFTPIGASSAVHYVGTRALPRPSGALADTIAMVSTVTVAGRSFVLVATYQFAGDLLAAVYVSGPQLTRCEAESERLAPIVAARLRQSGRQTPVPPSPQ
jgi:hypothetical protein